MTVEGCGLSEICPINSQRSTSNGHLTCVFSSMLRKPSIFSYEVFHFLLSPLPSPGYSIPFVRVVEKILWRLSIVLYRILDYRKWRDVLEGPCRLWSREQSVENEHKKRSIHTSEQPGIAFEKHSFDITGKILTIFRLDFHIILHLLSLSHSLLVHPFLSFLQ